MVMVKDKIMVMVIIIIIIMVNIRVKVMVMVKIKRRENTRQNWNLETGKRKQETGKQVIGNWEPKIPKPKAKPILAFFTLITKRDVIPNCTYISLTLI